MGQFKALDSARLVIPGNVQTIYADGLGKVIAENGVVRFALFTKTIAIEGEPVLHEVGCIVVLPLEAVMPAIRMTLTQLAVTVGTCTGLALLM